MLDTAPLLKDTDFPNISRVNIATLQFNLGYLCNLSCTHCHVNAGPKRTELADRETVDAVLALADKYAVKTLDLTGGAPELNPEFRYLVAQASERGMQVIDRCNLTILNEPGQETLATFLAQHKVNVTASLPCYQEKNVKEQRGKGVFESSISALRSLNSLGYGIEPTLPLNLVYNPNGNFLPPNQVELQAAYKERLRDDFGIEFHELLTITNMPISRFGSALLSKGQFHDYMKLLKDNHRESNLAEVMCRSMVSIDWQGFVYDCDFNQMLNWPLRSADKSNIASDKKKWHVTELANINLIDNDILIGEHCYGCTAGQGSSCGGALSD